MTKFHISHIQKLLKANKGFPLNLRIKDLANPKWLKIIHVILTVTGRKKVFQDHI